MDGQIGADAHLGPKVSSHLGSGEGQVDGCGYETVESGRWIKSKQEECRWCWWLVVIDGGCQMVVDGK